MISGVIMTKKETKKDIYDYDETKEYDENTNKRKMYEGIVFNFNGVSKEFNNIKNKLISSKNIFSSLGDPQETV